MSTDKESDLELGPQPLDSLMLERGLNNHALVEKSSDQLTHKAVRRGRNGRRLTLRMQKKILAAFNATLAEGEEPFPMEGLFNYRGR